jgi:outer membrane protein TolC
MVIVVGFGVSRIPLSASPCLAASGVKRGNQEETRLEPMNSDRDIVVLSRDDAMRLGEQTVPRLVLERARADESKALRVGAKLRVPENPRVEFDFRPGLNQSALGAFGYAVTGEVVFDVANAARTRVAQAEAEVELAQAQFAVARLDARALVAQTYVDVQLARVRVAQASERVTIAKRIEDIAVARLAAGAGQEIETSSAKLASMQAKREKVRAQADLEIAQTDLRYLLALKKTDQLRLTSPVMQVVAAPSVATMMAFATKARPEIKVLAREAEVREKAEARLKREAKPKLGALVGVDAAPASPIFGFLGFSFELPVVQRNQRQLAINRARQSSERIALALESQELEHQVQTLRLSFEALRSELELLHSESIPLALTRLALIEEGWRSGHFDVFRVTSAMQDINEMRRQEIDALEQVWRVRLLLERLIGGWPHA